MTLGSDIDATLPGLRAEAESRMTDTVTVGERRSVTGDDGSVTDAWVTTRYSGPGRIRWGSRGVTNATGVAMPVAIQEPYLSVPFGSARLFVGDVVVCDASADPLLVGRRFTVQGVAAAGQVTAYKYPLEEMA